MIYRCWGCGEGFATSGTMIQCPTCGSCDTEQLQTDFERSIERRLKENKDEGFEKFVSEAWSRLLQFCADESAIESESESELMERWLRWNREH